MVSFDQGVIMEIVQTKAAPAAIGPYSQAMISGNLIFTSGQIPLSPENGEVTGTTISEQAEQVIKNLTAVLEAAGSSLAKVVKTTCYLADMKDFAVFNEVYAKYFTGKPARSTVAVKQLPRNVLVEIEAIAEK
jgi:2-iminobutanoate/2-iminopropanoate deaminase